LDVGILRDVLQSTDDGRLGLCQRFSIVDITISNGNIVHTIDYAIVTGELIVAFGTETFVGRATVLNATSFGGFDSGLGFESEKKVTRIGFIAFFILETSSYLDVHSPISVALLGQRVLLPHGCPVISRV
jgi:hypothetical protein